MFGRPEGQSRSPNFLFLATAATLLLALFLGGGQGWVGEDLLALAGLGLIAAATHRALTHETDPKRLRWLFGLPLVLVALPILQLVPLPPAIWTHLPGREPLVADMVAAGVTPGWAQWTLDARATERILWSAVVPIGIFMAAATLHGPLQRRLARLAVAFAGFSTLVGLWQLMEGPSSRLYFYEITNRNSAVGFFANRNHLASLLAVSLPVTAGLLSDRLRQVEHGVRDLRVWLQTALIVVLAVGVTATGSRAGFFMLMLAVLAGALVLWRAGRHEGGSSARAWLKVGGAVAGLIIVQFTLFALLARLQADPAEDYRAVMTPQTLQAAAPVSGVGYGLGTFVQAYDELGDAAADQREYVNHAHNDFVELWLEGGLPALLLAAAAVVLALRALARTLRRPTDDPDDRHSSFRGLTLASVLGLALLLLHSGADYPLRTLSLAGCAALLAAMWLREDNSRAGHNAVSSGFGGKGAGRDLIG